MQPQEIQIETAEAATAAYIMSELVGRFDAELVEPSTISGRWSVVLRPDRDDHKPLLGAIAAVEGALRAHELGEATIRFGPRSYTIRNPNIAPRRSAA